MKKLRKGFSLIELLIVVAIIMTLAAVAIPYYQKSKMLGQESAAVQQIRTIQTMQAQYSTQFARYATQLAELGPPATGQASASAAGLIPGELSAGKKTGYVFALQGSPSGYVIHADPETYNSTGRRSFYSDESLVVRQNWGPEPATAQSPELK